MKSFPLPLPLLLLLLVCTMARENKSSPVDEAKGALNGYSSSSGINNHHSIPRDQYNNLIGGGNGSESGGQGSGGGGTN